MPNVAKKDTAAKPKKEVKKGGGWRWRAVRKEKEGPVLTPSELAATLFSPELLSSIQQLFEKIDADSSGQISHDEVLLHWKSFFQKHEYTEEQAEFTISPFFGDLDADGDKEVDMEEWMRFWVTVKKSGHSDEEISSMVEKMATSEEPWVHLEKAEMTGDTDCSITVFC
mmetsp:Transcript_65277/g.181005  ORF Transcript_65277/g.181005 Transcript_65277/m.181005 type:complete len:169 (-) Transcript_65277:79-585(-)|eukprot:CAMPEP_0119527282 /NCGR_PEP_ID=MMETSP1344-20130328/41719_1 /TAXON_ID=236787 /ORGANISM="Florenciella parvula, Strain CCMP2471" /LENGTH=168 /DNA_ID=CAMNT_0007566447 /DNA_START=55 /DNA_END=561 /DNA_ORIENTATION=-